MSDRENGATSRARPGAGPIPDGDQVSSGAITFADVAEQVRALLAALAQAQDDGRTEDLIALYTEDGIVEVPGLGIFMGAHALRDAFANWAPAVPQRHIVANTLITDWDGGLAKATSDVVLVQRGEAGWAVTTVARYHDTFRNTDGTWALARRSMEPTG